MKLLLDQGLPRSSASILRYANIDTIHVDEIGMAMAEDKEILEYSPISMLSVNCKINHITEKSDAKHPTFLLYYNLWHAFFSSVPTFPNHLAAPSGFTAMSSA